MAGSGSSMLYSFLLFIVILSLQEMYRGKLASSELFTILGGFVSSLLFLVLLTVSSYAFYSLTSFTNVSILFSLPGFFWMGILRDFYGTVNVLLVFGPVL